MVGSFGLIVAFQSHYFMLMLPLRLLQLHAWLAQIPPAEEIFLFADGLLLSSVLYSPLDFLPVFTRVHHVLPSIYRSLCFLPLARRSTGGYGRWCSFLRLID